MYMCEDQLLCAFLSTLLLSWTVTGARSVRPLRGAALRLDQALDQLERQKNLSTNEHEEDEEVVSKASKPLDPEGSWLSFVKHSERTDTARKTSKDNRKHHKKGKRKLTGLPGPRGAVGPQGPPGPPGGTISKEEILSEFRELVKEAAERRASSLILERCPGCSMTENGTVAFPKTVQNLPRVTSAFRCRLRVTTIVSKRTLLELKNYEIPFGHSGSFNRGNSFNAYEGRYTAPKKGVYQFTVSVAIKHNPVVYRPRLQNRRTDLLLRKADSVKVKICLNSSCGREPTLEHISGLESNSRMFTVSFTGLVEMQAGDYASVYVENKSSRFFSVSKGSEFSGTLVTL